MAKYFLDTKVLGIVGANAALIFNHIAWHIHTKEVDGVDFHDGKYWVYYSRTKLQEKAFDFFTDNQIKQALDKLVEAGLLVKGNYNKLPTDRTTWYALGDNVLEEYLPVNINSNQCKVGTDTFHSGKITDYTNIDIPDNNNISTHIAHTCACACEGTHEYVSQRLDQFRQEIANSTIKAEQVQKSYRIAAEDYETIVEQILLDWSVDDNITPNDINWKKLLIAIQYKVNANRKQLTQSFRLAKIKSLDINQRLGSFREKIRPHVNKYSKELCNRFYQYWTEMDEDGIMRFEYCYAFDVESRLIKFRDNEK